MRLIELSVSNYRSIEQIIDFKMTSFQSLLGENNCGKSNLLSSLESLLSAGSGGISKSDFRETKKPIVFKAKFTVTSSNFKKIWRPYLIKDILILEKHLNYEVDERTEKETVKYEFHGYKAEPKLSYLSLTKIKNEFGDRPKWKEIVEENRLPDYFFDAQGKCTKSQYEKGLDRYLLENDVEFDEPDISSTQALGFSSNVSSNLPKFYLLKAITNYSDEIEKRATNSTFRRLMADLSDRILKSDPRYSQVQEALATIDKLLNPSRSEEEESVKRLQTLSIIEKKIKDLLVRLMPSVEKIKLRVATDDIQSIFSRGVELLIDDGVETDVLAKGHGLQRCIVFALLQSLILNERNELMDNSEEAKNNKPIILAIEEPELYIHPQLGKLFFDVLQEFSQNHQVIYSTHSPRFIDVSNYEDIALLRKSKDLGTSLKNCDVAAFSDLDDRKIYKGLSQLNSDVNELFFSRNVLLVEGPEDKIAVIETAKKLKLIKVRPEELDITIVVAGGIGNIPFFIRVLNAFDINYIVLHDTDIKSDMNVDAFATISKRNQKIETLASAARIVLFPCKLEETVGRSDHFTDQYTSFMFFTNHTNINSALESIVTDTIEKLNHLKSPTLLNSIITSNEISFVNHVVS
jgi:putative ATP-dependent endonuclease of the OLD family